MKKITSVNAAVSLFLAFGSANTFAELKSLYKKASLLTHPDKAEQRGEDLEYCQKDINLAWEYIKNDPDQAVSRLNGNAPKNVFDWAQEPMFDAGVSSFYSVETMASKAWKVVTAEEFDWFVAGSNTQFVKDLDLEYVHYYGSERLNITDISNAYKGRGICRSYHVTMTCRDHAEFWNTWFQAIRKNAGSERLSDAWSWLESLEFEEQRFYGHKAVVEVEGHFLAVYRYEEKGGKQFSPFHIDRVKPLASMPKKWTKVQLRKIFANGQFREYRQDFYLTDDYARDAAENYRRGYIENPLSDFKDMLGSRDINQLWSNVSEDGTVTLHFGTHSNDGRSCIVDLDNRYPLVDMDDEEQAYLKQCDLLSIAN